MIFYQSSTVSHCCTTVQNFKLIGCSIGKTDKPKLNNKLCNVETSYFTQLMT